MPQLKRYRVHIYCIVRVPVDVEAESPEEAINLADTLSESYIRAHGVWTDDVEAFLVDELNADGEWDEHCQSIGFDKEKRRQ